MQDIYLDSIKLENVRSHAEMAMDFPIDNFTVIVGKNGAGKSTIFKSVSMALYGDDGGKKGERLSVSDMLPEKSPKNLSIILCFRIVENDITDNYEIRLYQNHSKFKNGFFLYKNNTDISGETKTATYELISNLLVPRDVYHNTVYFTQQVKDFFTALTNSEQKDIFDSILSMKIYDTYYKNTDIQAKLVLEQLQKIINEIAIVENKKSSNLILFEELQKFAESQSLKMADLKSSKIDIENNIQVKTNELDSFDDIDAEYNSVLSDLNKEELIKTNHDKEREDKKKVAYNEAAAQLRDKLSSLEKEKNSKVSQIKEKSSDELSKIQDKIIALKKEISKISEKYNTEILQKEIISYKSEKQREINSIIQTINGLDSEFPTVDLEEQLKIRKEFFDREMTSLKDKAELIKSNVKVINADMTSITSTISQDEESLNREVAVCSKCHRPFTDDHAINIIKEDINKNKEKLVVLQSKIDAYKIEMTKIKSDYEDYQVQKELEIKDIQERISHIHNNKKQRSDDLNRKITLLREECEEYVSQINLKIDKLNEEKSKEVSSLNHQEEQLINDQTFIVQSNQEKINDVEDHYTIDCNNIKNEHKLNYIQIISDIDKQYDDILKSCISNIDRLTIRKNELYKTKQIILSISNDVIKFKGNLESVLENITRLEKEIIVDDVKVKKIKSDNDEFDKKLNELISKKQRLERESSILDFWKSAFSDSGIKSMLIDVAIPYMNENVSECLEMAAPGLFTVSFDTLKTTKSGEMKDKFNVNIRHNIKGTSSHKQLSGGEKRLVDIACMYALRGLTEKLYGKRFHNIFYDEVLDALDEDTAAVFCQMSKAMSKDRNITLITHKLADHIEPDRSFSL